jgi:streptogramin lyase
MKAAELLVLPCLASVLLSAVVGSADPVLPRPYESLEAKVAGAESVFRGYISSVSNTVIAHERTPRKGEEPPSTPPDGITRRTATIVVEEVIKGPQRSTYEISEDSLGFDQRFEQWRDARTAFLWFVGGTRAGVTSLNTMQLTNYPTSGWRCIRLGEAVPGERAFYRGDSVPTNNISMDLRYLTNAMDVLEHARAFARTQTGPLRTHMFESPPVRGTGGGPLRLMLFVPVAPSLEPLAQRLIRAPEDFLREIPGLAITNDEPRAAQKEWLDQWVARTRAQGIRALRYFKSDANIALVKPFLEDPASLTWQLGYGPRTRYRGFPMRGAAYEVLKEWSVAVTEPVVQETLPAPKAAPALDVWTEDNSPAGVAVDRQGNLYVSNAGNSLVRKLTPQGTNWAVGLVGGSDYGEPTARHQNCECGIAVDGSGAVYQADTGRSVVRKFTPHGSSWTEAIIAGQLDTKGTEDGTNSAARFNEPSGIAVDKAGNVYVTDQREDTIRKLAPVGTGWVVTTIAGDPHRKGWWAPTSRAERLWYPQGLAVGGRGSLFVADSGDHEVKRLDPSGGKWVMTVIAGGDIFPRYADGTNEAARFVEPSAIAVDDSGTVYVVDRNFGTSALRKVAPQGTDWVVSTIAGPSVRDEKAKELTYADGLAAAARFCSPQGLVVDRAGNVFVADTGNSAIRKLTPEGNDWAVTTIIGGPGGGGGGKR